MWRSKKCLECQKRHPEQMMVKVYLKGGSVLGCLCRTCAKKKGFETLQPKIGEVAKLQ